MKWTLNTHCCVNLWALKNTSSLQLLFQVLPKGSSSSLHLLLHSRQSNFQIKLLHFSMSKHCNWEKLTQNWPCICLILQVLIILSLLHFEYIFLLSNHIAAHNCNWKNLTQNWSCNLPTLCVFVKKMHQNEACY